MVVLRNCTATFPFALLLLCCNITLLAVAMLEKLISCG
jgi:hypothetical protein